MSTQHRVADCPHRDLAVGWALHALEPAEEALVATHMPDCPACTRTVAQTEQIGATLGLSVPELIPSAELEQRVLAVTIDRRTAPVEPLPPPMQPTRPNPQPSRPGTGLLVAAAAVVLVAAVVGLGVRVAQLSDERNQAERQVTAVSEAIQAVADPAAIRVPLVANNGGAVGMVLASQDRVAVVTTSLPGNRMADQTYVLWGLAGQVPTALAAFDVTSEVAGLHAVPTAAGTQNFTGYAVSLEPGRRTPAAPTKVLASGQVRS
ncbi:MAG TPA: anti-sigma factor [Pseudonocardiaceae bacterium]|nr:anti-sigma factor [Pseudonocardiaceae bacterium]